MNLNFLFGKMKKYLLYFAALMIQLIFVFCGQPDIEVPNLPFPIEENPDTTNVVVDDPPWLVSAKERINEHRKADIQIKVVDAGGNPISGAEVKVKMTGHAFSF